MVGTGPQRTQLERLSGDRVRLLGSVPAEVLRELYRGALCVVQPGVEDFGISAVEALACGTPMVALGRGGILDIVEDGVHGALYSEEARPEALAEAIDKIRELRFNELDLRERAEKFSTARFLEGLRALFQERIKS